jgi:hypothetical protein
MPSPIGGVYTLADTAFENEALDSPSAPGAVEAVDPAVLLPEEDPSASAASRVMAALAESETPALEKAAIQGENDPRATSTLQLLPDRPS